MNKTNQAVKSVGQLKTEIRQQIWVSGEAENVLSAHDDHFQEAFAEIAKWVDCEQVCNVDVWPADSTLFRCGMTAVPAPRGIIRAVFTLPTGKWCHPVYFRNVKWPEPEQWARNRLIFTPPTADPNAKLGLQKFDPATDLIPKSNPQENFHRSRMGIYSMYDGYLWLAPWIQSTESVYVDWKGIKNKWKDDDLINPDQDYRKCVKLYMQYSHENDFGDKEKGMAYKAEFDTALADLMWQCRERTKTRHQERSEDRSWWLADFEETGGESTGPISALQLYHGPWPNPNENILPDDEKIANEYYQDGNFLNWWRWDVDAQLWQPTATSQ